MDIKEIALKLRQLVKDNIGAGASEVKEDSRFLEDLGADSMDMVELIMFVEEEFGIEITDDDLPKLQTYGQLLKFIQDEQV